MTWRKFNNLPDGTVLVIDSNDAYDNKAKIGILKRINNEPYFCVLGKGAEDYVNGRFKIRQIHRYSVIDENTATLFLLENA